MDRGNVTNINAELEELSNQFDEVLRNAATIVLIGVTKSGRPESLIPDSVADLPALICAIRSCLYVLESRYETLDSNDDGA